MFARIVVGVLTAAAGLLVAVAVWAAMAGVVPVLTFDVIDDQAVLQRYLDELVTWTVVFAVTVSVGTILGLFLSLSSNVVPEIPITSNPGPPAECAGAALGAAAATPFQQGTAGLAITIGTACFFGWLAVRKTRRFIGEVSELTEALNRDERLRTKGTRVTAEVTRVEFLNTWIDGSPLFSVTAEFDADGSPRSVSENMIADPERAPLVGGTVVVWYDGGPHVVMGFDPGAPLNPDGIRYTAPSWL
ncbi:hypothetical protein FB566_1797 [Stackebrandtia endophytica]|uniref:DUF3592 domain-containing protein n=1 Tax=Stackebrandtia endophytica TaxID=1496996 RepID=A0A543AUK8_9ACTN|nr:hypothetical protein [Stackebrandtia endophytica]TQL76273.1 hypothetical protein FB566_1797 [Stackebrandtia endophytica]